MTIQNLAPVKPLYDLSTGDNPAPTYIGDGLRDLFKEKFEEHAETFDAIAETTLITSNFVQGKQIFQLNPFTGRYTAQNLRNSNPNKVTAINIMQFYMSNIVRRITSSNPDLEPSEEFLRSSFRQQIKDSKAVWNYYERKFFTANFNIQEALHSAISGTYIEDVYYDHLAKGATVFKDIFGEVPVEISAGQGKCFSCGFQNDGKVFMPSETALPQCPECGSYEITHEPPESQMVTSLIDRQPLQMGDLRIKLRPIQSVRFDVRGRIEESSWAIIREKVNIASLRYQLGNLNIKASDATEDKGLQSLDSIQRAGNTLYGQANNLFDGESKSKDAILDKFSLSPSDYAHITALKDEETVGGQTIKKGTKLIDACPNGITVYGLNGLKDIIGIYPNAHHSENLSSGTFHARLGSGLGRGSEDTVEVQKRFNRFDAQNVKFMETSATPAHYYVDGAVDKKHVKSIGVPNAIIPIRQEMVTALGTTELIRQLPPGSTSAQFFQYTYDILDRYRQLTSHVVDFSGGLPGVNNKTATGANILADNASDIYTPMLQLKADCRRSTALKTIKLFAKHFKGVSQYFTYGKTASGQAVGREITGDDIDTNIEFVVVRNSEAPKTRYNKQQDLASMYAIAGGAAGYAQLKQVAPEEAENLRQAFDIDLQESEYELTEDICYRRMEQANGLMEQGIVDVPTLLMGLTPQIDVFEPNHDRKAEFFSNYLDTPEGIELPPEQRAVVGGLMVTHIQMAMQQQMLLQQAASEVQMAAQQPMMDEQNRQMQEQQQREDSMNQEQRGQQATDEQLKHVREMQKMEMQGGQAMELEKQRAQNKPAPKGK